jgi:hypothetical protein
MQREIWWSRKEVQGKLKINDLTLAQYILERKISFDSKSKFEKGEPEATRRNREYLGPWQSELSGLLQVGVLEGAAERAARLAAQMFFVSREISDVENELGKDD